MALVIPPVIDTFNRADETLSDGGRWHNLLLGGATDVLVLVSNEVRHTLGAGADLGPGFSIRTSDPGALTDCAIGVRKNGVGTSHLVARADLAGNMYVGTFDEDPSGGVAWKVAKYVAGTEHVLDSDVNNVSGYSSAAALIMTVLGDEIALYKKNLTAAGGPIETDYVYIGGTTDSTYGYGLLGIGSEFVVHLDDSRGGPMTRPSRRGVRINPDNAPWGRRATGH